MRSLAAVLLGYFIAAQLLSRLQPIPFLGVAITFLGYPLALRVGFWDLFWCELINLMFGFGMRFELILFQFQTASVVVDAVSAGLLWLMIMPPFLMAMAFGSAFIMKILSGFTPKRLKLVVMGI